MVLQVLEEEFFIYKLHSFDGLDLNSSYMFTAKTDNECSLVCPSYISIESFISKDEAWRAFRVKGSLDFSLIGILSRISSVLARNQIGIFVISTFDTDYVLVKKHKLKEALECLKQKGYQIEE